MLDGIFEIVCDGFLVQDDLLLHTLEDELFLQFTARCLKFLQTFFGRVGYDALLDVYFVSQYQMSRHNNSLGTDTFEAGEEIEHYVTLSYTDEASNPADGLFGKKYEWNRIESVEDFIAKEDLTDSTIASLEGKEWVLRFYETEWKQLYNDWYTEWQRTSVKEVSILRLKFETLGKVYNLGVVDNKQTGDAAPDNNNTNEYDFSNWGIFNWLKYVLIILAAIVLIILLAPILPYLIQAVVWIVMLPFKAIAALFKGIDNRRKRKTEPKVQKESAVKQTQKPPDDMDGLEV